VRTKNLAATLAVGMLFACSSGGTQFVASMFVKSELISASQGGTITVSSADSATLAGTQIVIPAHALSADTRISVGYGGGTAAEWVGQPSPTASLASNGATAAGPIVYIGPDGLTFSVPVTVTIPFAPLGGGASVNRLVIDALEGNGQRYQIANADLQVTGNFVIFQASGFTQFAADYIPLPPVDAGCSSGLTSCGTNPDGGALCVDLTSDGQNCGACGNTCASGVCDGGGCEDVGSGTTSSGGATSGGSSTGGGSTTSGTTGGNQGSSGTTSGGTTGASLGGPYVPYDAGPRFEPVINYDAGCTALLPLWGLPDAGIPFYAGGPYGGCVGCFSNSDCAPGLVCDTNPEWFTDFTDLCVQCVVNTDCPSGQVCNYSDHNGPWPWDGNDTCEPSCASDPSICAPGFCETDAGICYSHYQISYCDGVCCPTFQTGWCLSNSDCAMDGGPGACSFDVSHLPQYNPFASNGFGYCVGCLLDGGGCPQGEVCQALCPGEVMGNCVLDCFQDGGVCGIGSYCADAGPVGASGSPAGTCLKGCGSDSNCSGPTPRCLDAGDPTSGCVQCLTSTDCPDYAQGCTYNHCGACTADVDCAGNLFCRTASLCGDSVCQCHLDSDCPFDAPICVGGNQDAGVGGQCACTTDFQCASGYVCEMRAPYGVTTTAPTTQQGAWPIYFCGDTVGGACIPACGNNADCAASFAGTANTVCNTATGFCVPCLTDLDCTAKADSTQPYVAPKCLSLDGGYVFPSSSTSYVPPAFAPGGGACGCDDPSECNGGYTCVPPGLLTAWHPTPTPPLSFSPTLLTGTCAPACTYQNGIDSCNQALFATSPGPYQYWDYFGYLPPQALPLCNTFTGLCQECLDDYDCTSRYAHQPFCSDAGTCVSCFSNDDCAGGIPGTTCQTPWCSIWCTDSSTCPADGGFACIQIPTVGNFACSIPCVMGDDAGMGTVSDAGNPCPAAAPLCISNSYSTDPTVGVCAQCLGVTDTTTCQAQGLICSSATHEVDGCDGMWCYARCSS
jgi:Cys-rich repeat protein